MKDLYQVLRQKETDLQRVRREIEALLSVIPLLADYHDPDVATAAVAPRTRPQNKWPLELSLK